MKLCCLTWRITLKQKLPSGSPFLNELLMSSPFNLLEVAVLWHLTEQNNDGRNISVSYWLGSNLLGSAWFDTAFRDTSQYTFLEEEGKAEQIVIQRKRSFYVENYHQVVKYFGKVGVSDPLGNNWVLKTFCKLVLIYWIIICYDWNAVCCRFQLYFAAEKINGLYFSVVLSMFFFLLNEEHLNLKLVSWNRWIRFTLSDASQFTYRARCC